MGPVAQRLEQRTHNPLVPGSNPGGPTNQLYRLKICDAGASRRQQFVHCCNTKLVPTIFSIACVKCLSHSARVLVAQHLAHGVYMSKQLCQRCWQIGKALKRKHCNVTEYWVLRYCFSWFFSHPFALSRCCRTCSAIIWSYNARQKSGSGDGRTRGK